MQNVNIKQEITILEPESPKKLKGNCKILPGDEIYNKRHRRKKKTLQLGQIIFHKNCFGKKTVSRVVSLSPTIYSQDLKILSRTYNIKLINGYLWVTDTCDISRKLLKQEVELFDKDKLFENINAKT